MSKTEFIDSALALAKRGRAIFPMSRTKRPLCSHGVRDATRDPSTIAGWWRLHPDAVPAVATGEPSGVVVLDVDRQHGGAEWWKANCQRVPETEAYRTRSGGLHLVFAHRTGARTLPLGVLGEGVELRGDGASAIYWPAAGFPVLADVPPAPLPAWLLPPPKAAYVPPPPPPHAGEGKVLRYAEAALRHAADRVAAAGTGGRNATLNSEAFALARFAPELGINAIAETLATAAFVAGLPRAEVLATLRSALARGGSR